LQYVQQAGWLSWLHGSNAALAIFGLESSPASAVPATVFSAWRRVNRTAKARARSSNR
jgi:hypothetical protein